MSVSGFASDRRLASQLSRRSRAAARAAERSALAHAKAVRRRESAVARAREGLPRHTVVALAAGLASWPLDGGLAAVAVVAAGVTGWKAYRELCTLRLPPVPPPLVLPQTPPPLHPRSAAFPAVARLEAARDELARLLPLVAPVGRPVAEEAWQAAGDVDGALRWQAARLAAVEAHRPLVPELLHPLYEGVASQERLVVAVADLVAASADPLATRRLQDATDALHGLAQGLREVR